MDEIDESGLRALVAIRELMHGVSSRSRLLLRDAGLTLPQLLCLSAIQKSPQTTVAALAQGNHMAASTASTIVEKLVRRGLAVRVRSVSDRRRVELRLTPEGEAQLQAAPAPLGARFARELQLLPAAEREGLLKALERAAGWLGEQA